MNNAIGLFFTIYLVVSIIAGIVAAIRKRSQVEDADVPGHISTPRRQLNIEEEVLHPLDITEDDPLTSGGVEAEVTPYDRFESSEETYDGSMDHISTEGISHEWDLDEFDELDKDPVQPGLDRNASVLQRSGTTMSSKIRDMVSDRDTLRTAIVMSEILGKPKSMKIQ